MGEQARHDAWQAGDNYDAYMGRWSRRIAPSFLERLDADRGLNWLDVGCGTGALCEAILAQQHPNSVTGIDPSSGFVARAQEVVSDPRATFRVGDAQALPIEAASVDVVVSALVLNFVPDRVQALREMRRVVRVGGQVGFYVWDYPGGGVAFMRAFWTAAVALDPQSVELSEAKRFDFCEPEALIEHSHAAGLRNVRCEAIEASSVFRDFEDLWRPFTLGAGPAPGYCASLAPEHRDQLREQLRTSLPVADDGSIVLPLRAWGVFSSID